MAVYVTDVAVKVSNIPAIWQQLCEPVMPKLLKVFLRAWKRAIIAIVVIQSKKSINKLE